MIREQVRSLGIVAALLATCSAGVAVHAQAALAVSGQVRAEDGRAVARARIRATGENGARAETLTDNNGRYALSVASGGGRVAVTASRLGYAPGRHIITADAPVAG